MERQIIGLVIAEREWVNRQIWKFIRVPA